MSGQTRADNKTEALGQSRWLVFRAGGKKAAIGLEYMVKVLERAELFTVPLSGKEFKGIIYYNDIAVPVLSWEFLNGRKISGKSILILEQNQDLLGVEVDEVSMVEEHRAPKKTSGAGFWVELSKESGLAGLEVERLFETLRKKRAYPEGTGGTDDKENPFGG